MVVEELPNVEERVREALVAVAVDNRRGKVTCRQTEATWKEGSNRACRMMTSGAYPLSMERPMHAVRLPIPYALHDLVRD